MNIINKLYKSKLHMNDLQIKKINFNNKIIYVINIQTVSSSILTNEYILKYLSNYKDINNIPSISYIKINEDDVFNYLFNGFD